MEDVLSQEAVAGLYHEPEDDQHCQCLCEGKVGIRGSLH